MHVFLWLVLSQKRCDILFLWCKKRWAQVIFTERLKSVKSLWGQEEKIYQQSCVELQHTKQVTGLAFFYIRDVFGIGITIAVTFQHIYLLIQYQVSALTNSTYSNCI